MGSKSPYAIGPEGDCRECTAYRAENGCVHANAGIGPLPCGKRKPDKDSESKSA